MKATATKTRSGWIVPPLPALEDLAGDTVELEISLAREDADTRHYKEVRGIAITDQYLQKENRSVYSSADFEKHRRFRQKHGITAETFRQALKEL